MTEIIHNHNYNTFGNMNTPQPQFDDLEYSLFPDQQLYHQEVYGVGPNNFAAYHNDPFSHYSLARDTHPHHPQFNMEPSTSYNEAAPGLVASPDLNGQMCSTLSSASGQSASSSAIGSPYLNSVQAPVAEWNTAGYEANPSIAGDFGYDYTFGGSAAEPGFTYPELTKPIGFVGESTKISTSKSPASVSMSSSSSAMGALVQQSLAVNAMTSILERPRGYIRTPRIATSLPSSITPPWSGRSTSTYEPGASPLSRQNFSSLSPVSFGGRFPSSQYRASFKHLPPVPSFFSGNGGHILPPFTNYDPSTLHPYTMAPITGALPQGNDFQFQPPQSPALSDMSSRSSKRMKSSASSYVSAPNPAFSYSSSRRRGSVGSRQSFETIESPGSSDEHTHKGRCPNPECGKVFKDLKAHMLTHQEERPEKCPIVTCEYHVKGFARKYDKNRHTLTHYKGTMVCGFCPGSGSAAEKSFNRADVFKRHLTSVHNVEQTAPNSRKKMNSTMPLGKRPSGYAPDATGKCSTCGSMFANAQEFYEHLDDCVLRLVQQGEPSEAINAQRLAEVEKDADVLATLKEHNLPTTTSNTTSFADEDEEDDAADDEFTDRPRPKVRGPKRGLTHSKGGVTLSRSGRKKRKDYPTSWGCPPTQMKMKKRVMCVFDGQHRLWKDDMMLSSEFEVRIPLQTEGAWVSDLDIQTMRRAEALHGATQEERGPYMGEAVKSEELEKLMQTASPATA